MGCFYLLVSNEMSPVQQQQQQQQQQHSEYIQFKYVTN